MDGQIVRDLVHLKFTVRSKLRSLRSLASLLPRSGRPAASGQQNSPAHFPIQNFR